MSGPLRKLQYTSARTVYWRTQANGNRKYIIRFEIRYFFLEIVLSPSDLTQSQEKVSIFKPHYILSLSTGLLS